MDVDIELLMEACFKLKIGKRDVEADFFGGKANVSRAGAMFAVRCGSPVVVAQMVDSTLARIFWKSPASWVRSRPRAPG